ncbi:D-hexose-6-phosphate mutarotase [Phycicoccus endophyticus]|uniref:Putative glucose-6-phosphate 1-epimerase n=1 Tax=Phycicoccus endophyticus TaxID=1690220 RepID=A0A7G9R1R9_9MICO|nr:D-hexose-6-phosphate mutarotase [Phycicoccus endophyticus]NHI18659.1 D-hexose-6-phosphate mutarotase [Phycicoccus endophyticus]QNN49544.1 D-hexose-6-phosphate mutarotase [Phycicoccus endophyticus]GGL37451.1 D-hexose-6-phosphate mutarotase [Phycicoccus endophyticus]
MSPDAPSTRAVDVPDGAGEVLDQGALVLRWAPTGQAPVLFAHPTVPVRAGRPPHAGVPVCWPWFGGGPSGDATPSHGWARSATWAFVGEDVDSRETTLRYRLTSQDASGPRWPHPYRLDLVARLGAHLEVALTTTNTGPEPVTFEEALHAYLAVGDVREATLTGLDGAPFHDKVTGEDAVQAGDLVLTGETDRVYRSEAPVVLTDPVLGRRLRVETTGAADRVVWNPWSDAAAGLDDVGDQWPHLLCVEGANVLGDAVTLPPGDAHTLTYRLFVEDL